MEEDSFLSSKDYLLELMTFMGMKKLEYLYKLDDGNEINELVPFFGSNRHRLKKLLHNTIFLNDLCKAYAMKTQNTFADLISKYKKYYLFSNKYDTEDRILEYSKYMTSYQSLKKAARINDLDFINYMLNNKKLKYSIIHLEYLAAGFYDNPELSYKYFESYMNNSSSVSIKQLLIKAFVKACKYGVSIEIYNKYVSILNILVPAACNNIIKYQHQHLIHLVDSYDANFGAIICDNIELLDKNFILSNRYGIIKVAAGNRSIKILKYLNATEDEIINCFVIGNKLKLLKYLYPTGMTDEQINKWLYYGCFKSKQWIYKKYKRFLFDKANDRDEMFIEFLYNTGLIYQTDLCNYMLNRNLSEYGPEFFEILLKIKDDVRVQNLFTIEKINELQRHHDLFI